MSKHIFEQTINGTHYEIQIGWDKPTQEYYGTICEWVQDTDNEENGYYDDIIWSNLYHPTTPDLETIAKTVNYYPRWTT